MIYIWLFMTLVLLGYSFWRVRDFLNPAFISGAIWSAIYILLIAIKPIDALSSPTYGVFFSAYAAFVTGVLSTKPEYVERKGRMRLKRYEWNPIFRDFTFAVVYFFVFLWIIDIAVLKADGDGLWSTVRNSLEQSSILSSWLSGAMQNLIIVLTLVCVCFYLVNPTKNNLLSLTYSAIPCVLVMLLSPRGVWFMLIIAIAFLGISAFRPTNKQVFILAFTGVAGFVVIFVLSSLNKFAQAMDGWSFSDKLSTFFASYFINPPIAFVNWLDSDPTLARGGYLFRIVFAIMSKLGLPVEVVNTVQPFVIIDGVASNVYTSLFWYSADFGEYAILPIQFGLGVLFGFVYKRARCSAKPPVDMMVVFALLAYPLVNQFFDDVIVSRASEWIQRLFWVFIFAKVFVRGNYLGGLLLHLLRPIYLKMHKVINSISTGIISFGVFLYGRIKSK